MIRQGNIVPWKDGINIGNKGLNSTVLNWELSKLNITPISFSYTNDALIIYYYAWLQLLFRSKKSLYYFHTIKGRVLKSSVLKKMKLNRGPIKQKHFFMQKRKIALIDRYLWKQESYQLPFSAQLQISERINSLSRGTIDKVWFSNIYFINKIHDFPTLLNTRKFIHETPLVKSGIRSIYHIIDILTISDLLSRGFCSGSVMGRLIGKILERSTKKGLFMRSLRLITKLPTLINRFVVKNEKYIYRNWSWIIKVTGKLSGRDNKGLLYPPH